MSKGKLYVSGINDLKNIPSNIITVAIVRSLKPETLASLRKSRSIVIQEKRLSPSPQLFSYYLNNRNTNPNWKQVYDEEFSEEMKTKDFIDAMSSLRSILNKGYDVCIFCFCPDLNKCHRRAVSVPFVEWGYDVVYI